MVSLTFARLSYLITAIFGVITSSSFKNDQSDLGADVKVISSFISCSSLYSSCVVVPVLWFAFCIECKKYAPGKKWVGV